MDLMKLLREYQSKIRDNTVIIEYELFFKNIRDDCCAFAIDEFEELEELKKVISSLKKEDENAKIYVCTYPIDYTSERMPVYADTLWIDTEMSIEKLYALFENCRIIEPSDISLLADAEMADVMVELVVSIDGTVQDYKSFIDKREIDNIKSLYWD